MNEIHQTEKITLATKITILRICGIPIFVLLMLYYIQSVQQGVPNGWLRASSLIMFGIIALTDALDGFVARYRKEITLLGTILDPLADKAMMLSALVLLTRPGIPELQPQFPMGLTLLVISRDMILIFGAWLIHYLTGRITIHPSLIGKAATFFLMTSIIWALASWSTQIFEGLIWITGVLVGLSAIQYLIQGIRQLEFPE